MTPNLHSHMLEGQKSQEQAWTRQGAVTFAFYFFCLAGCFFLFSPSNLRCWKEGGGGLFLAGSLVCVCFFGGSVCACVCAEEGGKLERFRGRGLEQNSGVEPKPETHANLCLSLVVMKGSVQDTRDTN